MILRLAVLLVLSATALLRADNEGILFPKLSPRATATQSIGTTLVGIDYHRPAVKGRQIWGALVPFGQVWRTGANEATTLRFSDPVKVNGHPVPAGTYALFTIPGPDNWTIILNKRWKQFGTYEYQPKEDLLRFDVRPKVVKEHSEYLTYDIQPASRSSAYVDLFWEKLRVSFLVDVDVDGMVMARMKRALAKATENDWKLFCDSAEYLVDQERDLAQALTWAEKSVKIQENPLNLFVKARVLRAVGQGPQAVQVVEKALRLAKAQNAPASVIGPMQEMLGHWRPSGGIQGSQRR